MSRQPCIDWNKCGRGVCFSVELPSEREIATVKYSCDGPACAQIHPCPDGGLCGAKHAYDFDPQDKAKPYHWFGWTDSPLPAALTFQIGYPAPKVDTPATQKGGEECPGECSAPASPKTEKLIIPRLDELI